MPLEPIRAFASRTQVSNLQEVITLDEPIRNEAAIYCRLFFSELLCVCSRLFQSLFKFAHTLSLLHCTRTFSFFVCRQTVNFLKCD